MKEKEHKVLEVVEEEPGILFRDLLDLVNLSHNELCGVLDYLMQTEEITSRSEIRKGVRIVKYFPSGYFS